LPHVPGEDFVDERLVADAPATSLLPELLEDTRVHADRDELARRVTKWGSAYTSHRFDLRGGRLGDVAEVNPAPGTLRVRDGSPAAR
jgi:hypothetical protein